MKNYFSYKTEIGVITLVEENAKIIALIFGLTNLQNGIKLETETINQSYSQLCEYFAGKRKIFTVPLYYEGTDFQHLVWQNLCKIPYGKTITYKKLAQMIGNEKACRAVGMANNKNPLPIFIPCHRVIGSNGRLVGYAGGLKIKTKLLELEKTYLLQI